MNLHEKKCDLIFKAMDACAAHIDSKAHDAPRWWGLVQGGYKTCSLKMAPLPSNILDCLMEIWSGRYERTMSLCRVSQSTEGSFDRKTLLAPVMLHLNLTGWGRGMKPAPPQCPSLSLTNWLLSVVFLCSTQLIAHAHFLNTCSRPHTWQRGHSLWQFVIICQSKGPHYYISIN